MDAIVEKTAPRETTEELHSAPLANLKGKAESPTALELVRSLTERYPRLPSKMASDGKPYRQIKTKGGYEAAVAALLAELLAVHGSGLDTDWIRVSLVRANFTGGLVSFRQLDNVRKVWLTAGLIETKKGYPGALGFGNPGPRQGRLTRFRATEALLGICAEHGITSTNVHQHFRVEYEMPKELVQLTSPPDETPTTELTERLRSEVAELNDFIAGFELQPSEIRHIGWVRKFHKHDHQDFRWNKGGRLYSQPPSPPKANYQSAGKERRLAMTINGEPVAEIDISSSYLTIFYALCGQQLDTDKDAYGGILGPTELDREVAKFFINASFGNSSLISRWTKALKDAFEKRTSFVIDPNRYPMRLMRQKVLERHPLLERWEGPIGGRKRDWSDLMFTESEVIASTMLQLKRDYGVPSLPVHDSLIVPISKAAKARLILMERFREVTGRIARLKQTPEDPWAL